MAKAFASQADMAEKAVSFTELAPGRAYAYTAQGDPNSGVIVGDDAVMVIDTQATPMMARDVVARIRGVTDKPIRYVCLTHYHAVRVLGAAAYGAIHVIASEDTRDLIAERGEADMASEIGRFPRLFQGVDSIPGLTWPSITFRGKMTLYLGSLEVQILQLGRGHTKGDTVVWLPRERVLFSGDLVEYGATPYAGDAYLSDWPRTLDNLASLRPLAVVPGRGDALTTPEAIHAGIEGTRAFVRAMFESVKQGIEEGKDLKAIYRATYDALKPEYGDWVIFDHCLPFDVTRAYDEARGLRDPQIWTDKRDAQMWAALED
ncbi:MAG: MBL fold metallo-hydrolase [Pseudomonadota bacterium]